MVEKKCNFCNGNLKFIYDNDKSLEDHIYFEVGICEKCDLKQLGNFNHINNEFYSTNTNLPDDFYEERKRQHSWNDDRLRLLDRYIGYLWTRDVLDYGSGCGAFLESGKTFFDSIDGFDISENACKLNNNDNLKCYNKIDDLKDDYDFITLFHVLEHVKEPVKFLKDIVNNFKNTDLFIVEVPNTDEALVTLFNNENYLKNHYCLDHLWYFTEDTLKMILKESGLKVLVSTQIQRYPITNHFKWLSDKNEINFGMFEKLNDIYKEKLIENKIADSLFMICERL